MPELLDDRRRRIELAAATHRALVEPLAATTGPTPLLSRDVVVEALTEALLTIEREPLARTVRELGLLGCLRLAFAPPLLGPSKQAEWAPLQAWLENQAARAAVDGLLRRSRENLNFDPEALARQLEQQSQYRRSTWLRGILPDTLRVTVIQCVSMPAAPVGKVGFIARGASGSELVLLFGCSAEMNAGTLLDWEQWLRLGVWHMAARRFWTEALDAANTSPLDDERALSKLPERFRLKVGIHEASVGVHASWRSYFLDHLISASKVIGEEQVKGARAGREQLDWLASLGRFHLPWFRDELAREALAPVHLPRLIQDWHQVIGELTAHEPPFTGPIGATESAIWNREPRLVCSPSLDKRSSRMLNLWFRNYWPAPVTPVADVSAAELSTSVHCNLIFGLWTDGDWLSARLPRLELRLADGTLLDGADAARRKVSLAYAMPNQEAKQAYTRVCLAADAEALLGIHRGIRHFSDWTALVDGRVESGRATLRADGVLQLTT